MKNRTTEDKPTLVPARAMQWLEPGRAIDLARTESLADLLVRGTEPPHLTETPLTGKPDAGNPPVRFGGRGEVNPSSLPLSVTALQ